MHPDFRLSRFILRILLNSSKVTYYLLLRILFRIGFQLAKLEIKIGGIIEMTCRQTCVEKTCRDMESILQTSFGHDVIVADCSVENLLSLGENFTSYMKKVTAKIHRNKNSPEEVFHFVTKKNLNADGIADWKLMLKKEIYFYTEIIPFYARIELKIGTDKKETIAERVPKLYGHKIISDSNSGVESLIVFENIKEKGYYVVSKKKR